MFCFQRNSGNSDFPVNIAHLNGMSFMTLGKTELQLWLRKYSDILFQMGMSIFLRLYKIKVILKSSFLILPFHFSFVPELCLLLTE